jgi:nicotinate-nucleotide adenylyltransferase
MPNPDPKERWGILGGSFDPIHFGHLVLANSVINAKQLTGVLFIPSIKNPLKPNADMASFDDRLAMLRLAIEGSKQFEISDIEQKEALSGYTFDTMIALRQQLPQRSFSFLIGADLIKELQKWHRIDELFKYISFLAVSRPGHDFSQIPAAYKEKLEVVQANTPDISSTEIRTLLKVRPFPERLNTLLPQPVIAYIESRGLYR